MQLLMYFPPSSNKSPITYDVNHKYNATQFVLDISKTRAELGYEPKYSWKDYCVWFKKERELQRFAKLWGTEENYK